MYNYFKIHPLVKEEKSFTGFSDLAFRPGRAIVLPPASALAKSLTLKFFYVMGKALSGELSCPCDRSCLVLLFEKFW